MLARPYRLVLVVLLVVLTVLVVGVLVCVCCRTSETFATSTPPYYTVGTPVFIRFDGKTCFYAGVVTAVPTSKRKTYTVRYGKDNENPRNSATGYTEVVTASECYGAAGNTRPRESCRVFRMVDPFAPLPSNPTATQLRYREQDDGTFEYVMSVVETAENSDLYLYQQLQCSPSTFTNTMNTMYPLSFENLMGGITDTVNERVKKARQRAKQEKAEAERKAQADKLQAKREEAAKQQELQAKSAKQLADAERKTTVTTTTETDQSNNDKMNQIAEAIVYQKALELGYERGDKMQEHKFLVDQQIKNRLNEYDAMRQKQIEEQQSKTETIGGKPQSLESAKQKKEMNARTKQVNAEWKETQGKTKQTYAKDQQEAKREETLTKHLSLSHLTQPQAAYLTLVDSIMSMLWANTYIDVQVTTVNAAPSPTSDTYHACGTSSSRTVGAPPTPFYATTSGCTSPKTTLTNAQLDTHPKACTCTTYSFKSGQNINVHMVGSDVGGSRLCVFVQHVEHLLKTFGTIVGETSPTLQGFAAQLQMLMHTYQALRDHVAVQTVETAVHALRQSSPSSTSTALLETVNNTQMSNLVGKLANEVNLRFPSKTDQPAYTTPYNRILPFAGVAAHTGTSPPRSAYPDHFCNEHDALVSVGSGNDDLTAEVSIGAYANTTCARFDVNPSTTLLPEQAMLNRTRKGAAVDSHYNDTALLTAVLHVYLAKTCGEVIAELHSPTLKNAAKLGKTAFKQEQASAKQAFYASVKQTLFLAAAQMVSIVSTVTPSFVMTSKPFTTWYKTLVPKPTKSQLATRQTAANAILTTFVGTPQGAAASTSYLYPSPQNVPSAVTHVRVKVPSHPSNRHTVHVSVPWNTTVYGAQAFVDDVYQNTFEVVATPSDACTGSPCTCAVRIRRATAAADTSTGWGAPFHIYVTKRVFVERLPMQSYLTRFLSGYHHTSDPLAHRITHLPVYELSGTAQTGVSQRYIHGTTYRSARTSTCYRASCAPLVATTNTAPVCCEGAQDITDCSSSVYQPQPCPSKHVPPHATNAPCHQSDAAGTTCQAAFRQMLNNARNACLVLDTDAVPDFFAFLTDEHECGTNLRLLCKTVKTLTFTTTAFRDLSVNVTQQAAMAQHPSAHATTAAPVATNVPADTRDKALLLQRVLVTLFTCYGVVGLVAPPVVSDRGSGSDPSLFQQSVTMEVDQACKKCDSPFTTEPCARSSQRVKQPVFQMYNELTLTLQRKYENSKLVFDSSFSQSITLAQLQFFDLFVEAIETMVEASARKHHQAIQFFPSVPVSDTLLSTSCNPYMVSTIRGITWYGKDPLPKDLPTSLNGMLPPCGA